MAAELPEGKYRALVVDPPWPMQKILRNVRPNREQALDYPTLSLEQIQALDVAKLAFHEGCHIYLWTTQRFLPTAFEVSAALAKDFLDVPGRTCPTPVTPR